MMQQQGEHVYKPGKFSMELSHVLVKDKEKHFSVPHDANVYQHINVKLESEQEIIQRLQEDLDSTQREVHSLRSDVLKLKSEQKENEHVIQQLQQANKALYQRLDEIQSRCDCMEDQSRRHKDPADLPFNLWHDLDADPRNPHSLRNIYSRLLKHPLHDFYALLGNKRGLAFYDAIHECDRDGWSRDHHQQPEEFALDLSKRYALNLSSDSNAAESQSPPRNLSFQSDLDLVKEECHPVDLSSKSSYSEDVYFERASPDSGSNSSDWGPLQIDLSNVSDNEECSGQEPDVPKQNMEVEMEEENMSFISAVNDEELPEPSLSKISSCRRRKRGPKSWEFLMRLMADKRTNPSVIRWEDKEAATIRLIQPHYIAKLWGKRSSKPNLTYDHFARALRYHYKKGQLIKVSERQLVYGCGPQALKFLEVLLHQNQSRTELDEDIVPWTEQADSIPQDHTYFHNKKEI